MSFVLMPLRYSQGISCSMALVFLRYGGRILDVKRSRLPSSSVLRSSTRGWRTSSGPQPLRTVRGGLRPLRTTSRCPASSRYDWWASTYSATSCSIACWSMRRAPSRAMSSSTGTVASSIRKVDDDTWRILPGLVGQTGEALTTPPKGTPLLLPRYDPQLLVIARWPGATYTLPARGGITSCTQSLPRSDARSDREQSLQSQRCPRSRC